MRAKEGIVSETGRAGTDPIPEILAIARDHLGMELGFVAEFVGGEEVFRWVEGDTESFSLRPQDRLSLEESYCQRLVREDIGNVVLDATRELELSGLPATSDFDIGSYVGVPIRFSDGRVYGTFCCLSHKTNPVINDKDVEVVRALAKMVAGELERRELLDKEWRLQLQAAGIDALLAALNARDGYTGEHSEAVVKLTEEVARHLGLSDEEIRAARQVALLHDIGKIGVPDSVLRKPAPLDAHEWRLMREHPVIGARIVESIPGLEELVPAIRAEHERWDGNGYPDGLLAKEIPVASRIVFVCDAYHAMISSRPYRPAMKDQIARHELRRNAGSQFDPAVVEALLAILEEEGAPALAVDLEAPPIRVLVVDDDPRARMLLRFSLDTDGVFEVIGEAGDGAEAISFVRTEQPDAVVLDLAMPVMGGLETIGEIKQASPGTKIVVFSASDSPKVLQEAIRLGADVCLGKGVSLTEVNRSLQDLCTHREAMPR